MPNQPRVLGLLIALALVVSGGALLAGQYYRFSSYESTTGTMNSTGIERNTVYGPSPTDQDGGADELEGVKHYIYSPNVTYSYSVGGERHTGTTVSAGRRIVTDNRSAVVPLIPAQRAGATTTVYYDPGDPDDAHLLQRYRFFPAGLLLAAGLLVLTDTLTSTLRFVGFLTDWIPYATLERVPGVERTVLSDIPDDPTAVLDALRRWDGTGTAPIRDTASTAVWILCYLFLVDMGLVYFALASRPYDVWATIPLFAAAVGFLRTGFLRLLD